MKLILVLFLTLATVSSCKTGSIPVKVKHLPVVTFSKNEKTCTKRPIVIAVIDTGFGNTSFPGFKVKLCKYGHRDFTDEGTSAEFGTEDEVPVDKHGHGTHIAGIIDAFGKKAKVNYCLVILKYYSPESGPFGESYNAPNTVKAIKWATKLKVDYINYSGGGLSSFNEEKEAVKEFLDKGGKFIAAAGNEHVNIDFMHYYPAQDDSRVTVVGAVDENGERIPMSNYGTNVRMELGKNVKVCMPNKCMYMSGTSQATAIATGKLLAQEKNTCN